MKKEFIHLHQHTEFSLLDGLGKVKDVIKRAEELEHSAIAITDHGTCGGHYNFNKASKDTKVKPILGCEVYIVENKSRKGLFDDERQEIIENVSDEKEQKIKMKELEKKLKIRRSNHLVLLAENDEGLTNIYKIVSDASMNGFYYRHRTDYRFLAENKNGIIVLSACLAGIIQEKIMNGDEESAFDWAEGLKEIFGDNFYLELQPNKLEKQKVVNKSIIKIAKKLDINFVATNDNHYILKSDKKAHDSLLLLKQKSSWGAVEKLKEAAEGSEESFRDKILLFSVDDVYIKSYDEMYESFQRHHDISDNDIQTALENSVKIAEKCKAKLDFSKPCFPATKIPEKYDDEVEKILNSKDANFYETGKKKEKEAFFKFLIFKGWKERIEGKIPKEKIKEYKERLEFEYDVIAGRGYIEYFLVVSEFIIWAKERGILVGPGRGSAVGCLISYLLKITDIDPIPFGLFFERLLNPERAKQPDIDTDFQDDKREDVRKHIIEEYGEYSVAQVVAYSTMSINQCFRDVARVYDLPLDITNQIAKKLIVQLDAYKEYATVEYNLKKVPELKTEFFKHEKYGDDIQEIFEVVSRIQHQVRHASVAAAASVITEKEIYNYTSLRRTKDGLVIEWDGSMISKTNLLKMDLLGIKCLTIIKDTITMLDEKEDGLGKKVEEYLYNYDELLKDEETLALFHKGDTLASFQFDSKGIRETLKAMKPTSFEDVIAAAALYRPGPLSSGLVTIFCERKNGKYKETTDDKSNKDFLDLFAPFLKETYGVIVYQEQLIYIFHKVLGLNISDADLLRRAVDEKNPKLIDPYIKKIKDNFKNSQIKDEDTLQRALKYLQKISGYSFNKSHSAGYALVAYWTMFLKAHYPLEFGLATLNNRIEHKDMPKLFREFNDRWLRYGIEIKQIDINKSGSLFKYYESMEKKDGRMRKKKSVYIGYLLLKGIGKSVTAKISNAQNEREFKNIEDDVVRIKKVFNKSSYNVFIKVGAFDEIQKNDFGYVNRRELWHLVFAYNYKLDMNKFKEGMLEEDFLKLTKQKGRRTFDELLETVRSKEIKDYSNKELVKIERDYFGFNIFKSPLKDKGTKEKLSAYKYFIKNTIIQGDPILNKQIPKLISIEKALSNAVEGDEEVALFGHIAEMKAHISKKGNEIKFMTLEDETGEANCIIWDKEFKKYKPRLKVGEKIIFIAEKSIYKEKDVSFKIHARFKFHDPVLGGTKLERIVNDVRKRKEKKKEKERKRKFSRYGGE